MTMEESVKSVSTSLNQKHSLEIKFQGIRQIPIRLKYNYQSNRAFAVNYIENDITLR